MVGSTASGSNKSGSGVADSAWSTGETVIRPGQEDDVLEERAFSHGAMGVMYTVCKEKAKYGHLFIAFRLLADWLQLWLLVVQPPQFDLPSNKLWWQVINFISLNQFMSTRGYTFFLACFYLLVFGLLLSVGLSLWVGWSFQQNRFDHVWPIVILRWFAKIFYQVLDIMSLSLFLMALDCQTFARPDHIIGYNQEFPDVYCWAMPHLIHVAVAIISLILFLFLAGAFTVGEMELDFTTHNQLAIMHTGVELWTFIIRVLMTFVSVLVYNPKWASVAQLFLACWLAGLVWYWQLQLEGWVNHTRTGMYASVAWCSFLYLISAFNFGWDASDPEATYNGIHNLTVAMWATTIPVGALGALASWWRLRHFRTAVLDKFRHDIPRESPESYEFPDSRFVEVLARCCRCWVDKVNLQPDGVLLAEKVLRAGLVQLPKDPFMVILYSSYLMDVQSSYQSGYTQLQAAKKLELSFLMRFAIFSREQQHAQRSTGGKLGNQAADLVSYVEFQRNYSMALKVHRDTLVNIQRFWECMLHKSVKFRTLSETVKAMDMSIRQAERVYKTVVQRHATSVKIVRLYAKFLEQIKQDPWAAAKWFSEAERLEATEEDMKQQDTLGGAELDDPMIWAAMNGGGAASSTYGQDMRGVIVMNAQSIIQMTNTAAHTLLGFNKAELQGKNMRIILPPSIADQHTTYVRNYIATGRPRILNHTRQQVAMHKDRRMLPIWLNVTKIKGIGEDSVFMAVMEPIVLPKDTATVWLMMDGTIMTASDSFADWFGFSVTKEVQGKGLAHFVVNGLTALDNALKQARHAQALEDQKQIAASALEEGSTHPIKRGYSSAGSVLAMGHSRSHTFIKSQLDAPSTTAPAKVHMSSLGQLMLPLPEPPHEQPAVTANIDAHPLTLKAVKAGAALPLVGAERKHSSSGGSSGSSSGHDMGSLVSPLSPALGCSHLRIRPSKPQDDEECSWSISHVQVAHKYAGPVDCEVSIANGGMGAMQYHVLSIRKLPDNGQSGMPGVRRSSTLNLAMVQANTSMPQDLMVVADSKGQLVHITEGLLERLGRRNTLATRMAGLTGLEQLMVKPFGQLHKTLVQAVLPVSVPPYSCRSGLSVLLQGQGPQGQPLVQPFKLAMRKKVVNEDTLHVVLLQERSMEQALDERRLLLEVNEFGIVSSVSRATPASLLGCEPDKLQGKHVCSFLDILRPLGVSPTMELDLVEQDHALTLLLEMLTPSLHYGSAAWRAGFISPDAAAEANKNESQATAKVRGILSGQAKPVLVRLRARVSAGPQAAEEGNLTVEMELWRSDLVAAVVEVDKEGVVQPGEQEELDLLYPPDLLLGTCEDTLLDAHISTALPALAGKPLSELMTAGAFGAPLGLHGGRKEAKRSAMKTVKPAAGIVGPVHVLTTQHQQDKAELQVAVQAVRKTGHHTGFYLLLHPMKHVTGRHDFASMLAAQRQPGMQPDLTDSLAHRASVVSMGMAGAGRRQRRSSLRMSLNRRMNSMQVPLLPLPDLPGAIVAPRPPNGPAPGARFVEASATPPRSPAVLDSTNMGMEAGGMGPQMAQQVSGVSFHDAAEHAPRAAHVDGHHMITPRKSTRSHEEDRNSGKSQLHPHERERISAWLHGAGNRNSLEMEAVAHRQEQGASEASSADQPADGSQASSHEEEAQDVPDEAEDHQVDEGDYKRGQRFKKLYAMLGNQQVQRPVDTYRRRAYLLAASVCVIQMASFITMYILLQKQTSMVTDLARIGKGGVRATEIAVYSRAINIIYANMTVPTLRLIRDPGDLPYLKSLYKKSIDEFKDLHRGAFLGYEKARRLPVQHGLRSLWEDPLLTVIETNAVEFNQSLGNFTVMEYVKSTLNNSLWTVGNRMASKAANIYQNSDAYNASLNGSIDTFMFNPNLVWIIDNAPGAVFPGYLKTLDSYLELVIDSATGVNKVQLILLVLEGVLACGVISWWMWLLLDQVAQQRFRVYHIFMLVPLSLVRRLATRQYILGDEEEEEGREDNPQAVARGLGATSIKQEGKAAGEEAKAGSGGNKPEAKPAATKINIHVKQPVQATQAADEEGKKPQWLLAVKTFFSFGRTDANVPESKRQLVPCKRTTLWLLWPFLLWGVFNVLCNALGFMLLKATSGPVAMFNMVNYVNLMYNRNNFFLQELTFEPDPSKMDDHRAQSQQLVMDLEKEYKVMLYGRDMVPNETKPHYRLVTQGLAYGNGEGPTILFSTQDCLCLNDTECQPPDSHLYTDTRNGLDRLMLKYIAIGNTIDLFQYLDPYMNGPQYDYYWNTVPDISGGFSRLTDAYQAFVTSNIASVTTLHIAIFVLTLLLVLGFLLAMLRPFLKVTTYETRRIAELLSQLPPEVEVATLVQATLLPQNQEADVLAAVPAQRSGKMGDEDDASATAPVATKIKNIG